MPFEFDIRPMVEKHSAIPVERLRVLRRFDELELPRMRRGIVFVFAAWSGPAVMGFKRFTTVMKSIKTGSLDLVVLDTDCLSEDSSAQLFGVPSFTTGGWGEILWVRDGRIVARELGHTTRHSLIEQHTKELLDDDSA